VKLACGWLSFEKYFEASTWPHFGSDHLQQAIPQTMKCPELNQELFAKWFPVK
jgi:hypothetical protein